MGGREEPEPPKTTVTTEPKSHTFTRRLIELNLSWSFNIHTIWQPFPLALFFSPLASRSHHLRSIIIGLFLGSLLDLVLIGIIKYLICQPRPVYNKGMHLTVY
ncbi:hypothetical protein NE237_032270 [Protea cynaroides]|uniref:Uncharacterized protein n=1 Tax=Protea cynaroides TaxID=273540 RepID=A0A9Q0R2Y0_9MAGN|nr:hypothetical protein NE237_032270 [Protea cynaroides]